MAAGPDRVDEDKLAERTGVDREHLRRLADLGILGRGQDGTDEDLERGLNRTSS